jgi:hypothetical protein
VVDGIVHDGRGPEVSLEHHSRSLAGSEAGHARLPTEASDGLIDGLREALGRKLELELEAGLGKRRIGGLHCRAIIGVGAADGRGCRWDAA